MIYSRYGIKLVRLEADKIEMLRQWRNTPEIVKNMEFQEFITPGMQAKWFDKINNINNFYFLIKTGKELVGMIHLSNIDYNMKKAESGIFISHRSYINTTTPVLASFTLLDFAFNDLKLEHIHIKVGKHNKKVLKYNLHLGFIYSGKSTNQDFIFMQLSYENYKRMTMRLRAVVDRLHQDSKTVQFNMDNPIDRQIKARFFPSIDPNPTSLI